MERWLKDAYSCFLDVYNCLDGNSYFFWDEAAIEARSNGSLAGWLQYARDRLGVRGVNGMDLEDHGGRVSVCIRNFGKSCYLPFLTNQLAHQTLSPDRFEIIFTDTGHEEAFLPVVRFCKQRWPELNIRAFETHEDTNRAPTTGRNVGARRAQYETLILLDSDWLPVGKCFLESLLRARRSNEVVRGVAFGLQDGGTTYGRWLRGPTSWTHQVIAEQTANPPPNLTFYDRWDADFFFAVSRDMYHEAKGFPENVTGGGGIESKFFGPRLRGYRDVYCLDALACNLNIFVTHFALEKSYRQTQGGGNAPSPEWGTPPTLEDLTPLLNDS